MKEFSHPGAKERTAVDLARAIDTTVTVATSEWKYVADMVTDFDPKLPPVPCLPGELNQVILNLIVNAAHAIGDVVKKKEGAKGVIKISTRADGPWAEIKIADTGAGIPESIRHRIFDPFFTTKEVGRGTGQGLAIAWSTVVDKHHGRLTFESTVGQGTTFTLRLPLGVGAPASS
jgi:signal transduction histidine kinase